MRADARRARLVAHNGHQAATARMHAAALRMLAVAVIACCAPLAIAADAALPLAGTALRDALLRGGYVLYLRHTATDFGQNDDKMTGYEDCAQQRNLTDRGRADARAISAAITALHIPVTTVLASPFCRTRETAELVFGHATPDARVRGGPATTDDPARYAQLKALLSTPVPAGTNIAIVSHGNPFRALAGPPYLAEGEMAVIEPLGTREGFRIVGKVAPDAWSSLR